MEIAQSLVRSAYQSMGYFVIEGVRIGVREVDLLAIKLGRKSEVVERLHIEVQISTHPIGVLRGKPSIKGSKERPLELAQEYINKKFNNKLIIERIIYYYGEQKYNKVFVYGVLREPGQLKIFKKNDIQTIPIKKLIRKAMKAFPVQELIRTMRVHEIIG